MIKYCMKKWDKNRDVLEAALQTGTTWNSCNYSDLVKLVVNCILNGGAESDGWDAVIDGSKWDAERITEIDNGDYQGTLIYTIPTTDYQPSEYDYLMTYVWYGSCSGCDTLLAIQSYNYGEDVPLTDSQVQDFMTLCKDIVANMIRPYNTGWRASEEFEPCGE